MYLQKILPYIIISSALFIHCALFAQEETSVEDSYVLPDSSDVKGTKSDDLRIKFLRLGVDPFSTIKSFIYPADVSGITFQLDTEIKEKYFPVVELGNENFRMKHVSYDMQSTGFFLRLGVDQNFVSYLGPDDRDMFFAGIRYCIGSGASGVSDIILPNTIGNESVSVPNEAYFTQWGELVTGVKTELFSNFFLGWTARVKRRFSFSDHDMNPYYIAGYGVQENLLNVEMSVQVLYALPYKNRRK